MALPKAGFGEISPLQLMRLIGLPDAPLILDTCLPEDVALDPVRIPTAVPVAHTDLDDVVAAAAGRRCVVVCQKGKKLSHGVAAHLRANGIAAEVLCGGMVAWRAADLPAIPLDRLPKGSRWVTRHRPKIDRLACPWLIRRFIDPAADILYVPPSEVSAVAQKFEAIAFDTPEADFTHQGTRCTFDALLDHFDLRTSALDRVSDVVRAADTGTPDMVPEAAGLLAISVGLSRQFKDDQSQLAAALPLYDALYRWSRDGHTESHDWTEESQP